MKDDETMSYGYQYKAPFTLTEAELQQMQLFIGGVRDILNKTQQHGDSIMLVTLNGVREDVKQEMFDDFKTSACGSIKKCSNEIKHYLQALDALRQDYRRKVPVTLTEVELKHVHHHIMALRFLLNQMVSETIMGISFMLSECGEVRARKDLEFVMEQGKENVFKGRKYAGELERALGITKVE